MYDLSTPINKRISANTVNTLPGEISSKKENWSTRRSLWEFLKTRLSIRLPSTYFFLLSNFKKSRHLGISPLRNLRISRHPTLPSHSNGRLVRAKSDFPLSGRSLVQPLLPRTESRHWFSLRSIGCAIGCLRGCIDPSSRVSTRMHNNPSLPSQLIHKIRSPTRELVTRWARARLLPHLALSGDNWARCYGLETAFVVGLLGLSLLVAKGEPRRPSLRAARLSPLRRTALTFVRGRAN